MLVPMRTTGPDEVGVNTVCVCVCVGVCLCACVWMAVCSEGCIDLWNKQTSAEVCGSWTWESVWVPSSSSSTSVGFSSSPAAFCIRAAFWAPLEATCCFKVLAASSCRWRLSGESMHILLFEMLFLFVCFSVQVVFFICFLFILFPVKTHHNFFITFICQFYCPKQTWYLCNISFAFITNLQIHSLWWVYLTRNTISYARWKVVDFCNRFSCLSGGKQRVYNLVFLIKYHRKWMCRFS